MSTPTPQEAPPSRRKLPAIHPPDARVRHLLDHGWSFESIAARIGASPRAVYRWAAGDAIPMRIFVVALTDLVAKDSPAPDPTS